MEDDTKNLSDEDGEKEPSAYLGSSAWRHSLEEDDESDFTSPASLRCMCTRSMQEGKPRKPKNFVNRLSSVRGPPHRRFFQNKTFNVDAKILSMAISGRDISLLTKLLETKKVNPNCADDRRRTPLHIAAAYGGVDCVRLLLKHGADPNRKDSIGNTPLHLASSTSNLPIVTLLLEAGTDILTSDNCGLTPLTLIHSRLRHLMKEPDLASPAYHLNVQQVAELILVYLKRTGREEEGKMLSQQLQVAKDQMELNSILAGFSGLTLASASQTGKESGPTEPLDLAAGASSLMGMP